MERIPGFFDASIGDLLDAFPDFVRGYDCLITRTDSSDDVVRSLEYYAASIAFERYSPFVVLPGPSLLKNHQELLPGFDEVFCFRLGEWRAADPSLWFQHFTSEAIQVKDGIPQPLDTVLQLSGAVRFLSDGCGLNCVAEDAAVMERVGALLPPWTRD